MSTVYDVAVVGSGGFLGSAITAALTARGANVGGFTKDRPFTGGASAVVWAAGHVTPVNTDAGDRALADLAGLIEIARRSAHPTHVILLSSGGAVYGPPATAPFSEEDEPTPANEYGRIKFAEEQLLSDSDVPHTVLRVANPYGPGQTGATQGVLGAWLRAVRDGQPVTLFGDGSAVRDYVFIDDFAAAAAAAAERLPGGVINIGSGEGTSLAELLDIVTDAVAPIPVEVRREPSRGIDAPAVWLDVTRARETLDWTATTPLAEGIARTWEAIK